MTKPLGAALSLPSAVLLLAFVVVMDGCGDSRALSNQKEAGAMDSVAPGGGSGGGGGGPGTGGSTGRDSGPTCDCGAYTGYHSCCGASCTNLRNDPLNCGTCGNRCPADKPFCADSTCGTPPCSGASCGANGLCCGPSCCKTGQICCSIPGPVGDVVDCFTPTTQQPTCPRGCAPLCMARQVPRGHDAPVSRDREQGGTAPLASRN
jgi:hypothetical protein